MRKHLVRPGILWRIALLIILVLIATQFSVLKDLAGNGLDYLRQRDFNGFRDYIRSFGIWAPGGCLVIMILQSMFPIVPGIVVTMANAWMFGWGYGALLSWSGALIGATCDYLFARWYGRPVVEYSALAKHLPLAECYFARYGVLSVFIARLIPIVPFKVISYSAGISGASWLRFILATGLGQGPPILLYSYFGKDLTAHPGELAAAMVLFLLVGTVLYYQREVIIDKFCRQQKIPEEER